MVRLVWRLEVRNDAPTGTHQFLPHSACTQRYRCRIGLAFSSSAQMDAIRVLVIRIHTLDVLRVFFSGVGLTQMVSSIQSKHRTNKRARQAIGWHHDEGDGHS